VIVSFYGVNLKRDERLADDKGSLVMANVAAFGTLSMQVEHISGTWTATTILHLRKINTPYGIGVAYATPVTLNAAGMTELLVSESEYVVCETSVGEGTDLIVNIHFHLRETTGVVA